MVVTLAQELEASYFRVRYQGNQLGSDDLGIKQFFEWIRLKEICEKFHLEECYQMYSQKIYRNYIKTLIRIHLCIGVIHGIAVLWGSDIYDYYSFDSVTYIVGAILVCLSLAPYLSPYIVVKYPSTPYVVSWISCILMVLTDCCPSIAGYSLNKDILSCCYDGYTISVIYLFMPIPSYIPLIILAVFISFLYCLNSANSSYEQHVDGYNQFEIRFFIPSVLFLMGINVLGICFRIRHDYHKRRIFLTKSLNIEENLLLRYAKDHEHNLLLTIIPAQIAKKIEEDIKSRIESSKQFKLFKGPTVTESGRKLFIEPHYNVSILFADLVNYTYLTTTLDVKTLVETLHELFQRFDSACEEFNCMRIKFLGDCYYCVAGVPQTHPYHALCCTELGRAIIKHIEDVRNMRSLDIDMRIGIHSGNILSGIIGAAKWQYDIWSKDVDIASRLEQTGEAGRVHISQATLNLIKGYYEYETGTEKATKDPLLQKERILTYLIIQHSEYMTTSSAWNDFRRQYGRRKSIKSETIETQTPHSSLRSNVKFDAPKVARNTILDYATIRRKANAEMAKKVKNLPVCKLSINEQCFTRLPRLVAHEMEDYKANRNISVCCLWYEDWHWETLFNREKDGFFKMSVLTSVLAMWCIMGMQASNKILSITFEHALTFFLLYTILFMYSILILVASWFRTIWDSLYIKSSHRPHNKFPKYLYRLSQTLERMWLYRTAVYISLVICLLLAAFVHLMSCDQKMLENDDDLIHEFISGGRRVLCFNSWAVTESISLCLALIMTFNHIPHCLSFTVGILVLLYYIAVIFLEFPIVYESSIITNRSISTEYSHIWSVATTFFIYQLMNRHVVFLARINAYSKWNVDKKREDAHVTNESIKILLHNILPSHVVNIYLSKRLRNEAYYEQHEFVAVMFATITYARSGSIELRLLNEIICDFDEVLSYYKGSIKVEKIKVANWSYMAACGFNIFSIDTKRYSKMLSSANRGLSPSLEMVESMYNVYRRHSSRVETVDAQSESSPSDEEYEETEQNIYDFNRKDSEHEEHWKERQRKRVLNVMTHFALDLLRSTESFNVSNQWARGADEPPLKLKIGISCGEVMAGVVGSSQAHYDIWGNAVNMASRMDSTGEPGRIQVTEEAAEMLTSLNIACEYRGLTYVKGRGEIPTYFVRITKDMTFEAMSTHNSFDTFRSWFK